MHVNIIVMLSVSVHSQGGKILVFVVQIKTFSALIYGDIKARDELLRVIM